MNLEPLTLTRHAMATRFELVMHGENATGLRASGEEALDEIDRLEAQLSLYRPTSEIARVNARAAREPVRVIPPVFALLQHAQRLWRETNGAFDITIAPLVRAWGFMGGGGQIPSPDQRAEARANIGMQHVILDAQNSSVRFNREGVMLDLGAIGKGYAVQRAADLLRETGVTSALLHGGTSTVYAIGKPVDGDTWRIAIDDPANWFSQSSGSGDAPIRRITSENTSTEPSAARKVLLTVAVEDEALSVSAISEKYFRSGGKVFGHVLDPRSGEPATNAVLAAVALASATETDALSTALLVVGVDGHDNISKLRPEMRTLVVEKRDNRFRSKTRGLP